MIGSIGKGKAKRGFISCAKCGQETLHPTIWSDGYLACWCKDPDRCPDCGPCEVCFPGGAVLHRSAQEGVKRERRRRARQRAAEQPRHHFQPGRMGVRRHAIGQRQGPRFRRAVLFVFRCHPYRLLNPLNKLNKIFQWLACLYATMTNVPPNDRVFQPKRRFPGMKRIGGGSAIRHTGIIGTGWPARIGPPCRLRKSLILCEDSEKPA